MNIKLKLIVSIFWGNEEKKGLHSFVSDHVIKMLVDRSHVGVCFALLAVKLI